MIHKCKAYPGKSYQEGREGCHKQNAAGPVDFPQPFSESHSLVGGLEPTCCQNETDATERHKNPEDASLRRCQLIQISKAIRKPSYPCSASANAPPTIGPAVIPTRRTTLSREMPFVRFRSENRSTRIAYVNAERRPPPASCRHLPTSIKAVSWDAAHRMDPTIRRVRPRSTRGLRPNEFDRVAKTCWNAAEATTKLLPIQKACAALASRAFETVCCVRLATTFQFFVYTHLPATPKVWR
jgi:hypothetical protein